MIVRKTGNVLGIKTAFPTIQGAPSDNESGKTENVGALSTSVDWPNNWRKLTPKWRAQLLARLVKKVIDSVVALEGSETRTAFKELTGWKF